MLDLSATKLLSMLLLIAAIGCSEGSTLLGTGGTGGGESSGSAGGGGGGGSAGAGSSGTAAGGGGGGTGGLACDGPTFKECRQGIPGPGGVCGDVVQGQSCVNGQWVCPNGWFSEALCDCIGPPPPDAGPGWCHPKASSPDA
jgi:hypothetical protein